MDYYNWAYAINIFVLQFVKRASVLHIYHGAKPNAVPFNANLTSVYDLRNAAIKLKTTL